MRHLRNLLRGCAAFEQHRELVAPQSGQSVLGADAEADPHRDQPQELVARGVTEGVVHVLELVEIEEQNRDQPALGGRGRSVVFQPALATQAGHGLFQALGEQDAIG